MKNIDEYIEFEQRFIEFYDPNEENFDSLDDIILEISLDNIDEVFTNLH